MNEINFIFDKNIKWKNAYRRVCKSKTNKHILCFPDHSKPYHIVFILYTYIE